MDGHNTPKLVGTVSFANGDTKDFTDPQEYLNYIKEELPYHPTTGFRYYTLSDDPELRYAVDVLLYDLFGMEPPEYEGPARKEGMELMQL